MPKPAKAASRTRSMRLKESWPSTRTFSSRPSFSNSHAQKPPREGRRWLMQTCLYDRTDKIPFDKITAFFNRNL